MKMSENGKIQYKIGDRVRFRLEQKFYRDKFNLPNEFIVSRRAPAYDAKECCLVYGVNSGIGVYGSRLELVEADKPNVPKKTMESNLPPEIEVPARKGETRWGLVDKNGTIVYILSTRQMARDTRDSFQNQYKVKKLFVSIAEGK